MQKCDLDKKKKNCIFHEFSSKIIQSGTRSRNGGERLLNELVNLKRCILRIKRRFLHEMKIKQYNSASQLSNTCKRQCYIKIDNEKFVNKTRCQPPCIFLNRY